MASLLISYMLYLHRLLYLTHGICRVYGGSKLPYNQWHSPPGPAWTQARAIKCCTRGSQCTIERGVAGLRLHVSILCVVNATKQIAVEQSILEAEVVI